MSSESKKILIITYYWPPAGGPGVQRWLKFVKYLPEFGWEPVVFIPENPSYPIVDETLESEVPEDLKVIKTKILEPYQIAEFFGKDNKKFKAGQFDVGQNQSWKSKLSIWIRGNFFIPDARVFWVRPSVKFLRKYLKENHIDALVTTGPPHSLHLMGLQLKKEFPDMKWIADFRDPWTEISYYQHLKLTKKSDQKHRKLEEKVFKNADITLATSFMDAENFRQKGANAICITNGFDTEIPNKSELKRNEKFTLSYIGVLEQLRNPEVLWQVLNEIITENQEFKDHFELKFVGRIDDKIIKKIQNTPLHNMVNNLGYLSHSESNKEMQKSDVLMVTNFPNEKSKGIIPGKIFEYLATGKTVLSFGPKGADVARILEETKAGHHFNFDQKEEVKSFLLQQFEFWKNNEIQRNPSRIDQYSRRNLTHRLSEIL